MSRFSQAFRTTNTSAGAAIEFIAGSADRARLVELELTITSQVDTAVGLGFPGAKGITPTSPVAFQSENPGDGSTCGISSALAWVTAPTTPTNGYYFRRAFIPAAQQFRVRWSWPEGSGLLLLPSTSLALFLLAAGAAIDGYAVFEE